MQSILLRHQVCVVESFFMLKNIYQQGSYNRLLKMYLFEAKNIGFWNDNHLT